MQTVVTAERPDLGGNMRFGDAHTFTPRLWKYLIDRFGVRSMLDVGCGEGHTVRFFFREGVQAHGIDGLRLNIERGVVAIALHDLTTGPYIMPVDLTWSCEVAEHILPEYVDYYLDTLANGRVVAMTHGIPGQEGHHHVNLQPTAYWVEKMSMRGYELERSNEAYRKLAEREDVPNYFAMTGLVFVRTGT